MFDRHHRRGASMLCEERQEEYAAEEIDLV